MGDSNRKTEQIESFLSPASTLIITISPPQLLATMNNYKYIISFLDSCVWSIITKLHKYKQFEVFLMLMLPVWSFSGGMGGLNDQSRGLPSFSTLIQLSWLQYKRLFSRGHYWTKREAQVCYCWARERNTWAMYRLNTLKLNGNNLTGIGNSQPRIFPKHSHWFHSWRKCQS